MPPRKDPHTVLLGIIRGQIARELVPFVARVSRLQRQLDGLFQSLPRRGERRTTQGSAPEPIDALEAAPESEEATPIPPEPMRPVPPTLRKAKPVEPMPPQADPIPAAEPAKPEEPKAAEPAPAPAPAGPVKSAAQAAREFFGS